MKKDELVHLHTLLTLLRAEFERREEPPEEWFARYDDLGVSPMAVYGSKTDHARAVQALAGALAALSRGEESAAAESPDGNDRNVTVQS